MKRCSTSLIISDDVLIQIKTTMRYNLALVRVAKINNSGKSRYWRGCGEMKTFCTVGGNANWCSCSGKVWRFLKKLKTDLSYDPAIALLGIYPRDTGVLAHRGTCTPMSIAALSTIGAWFQLDTGHVRKFSSQATQPSCVITPSFPKTPLSGGPTAPCSC